MFKWYIKKLSLANNLWKIIPQRERRQIAVLSDFASPHRLSEGLVWQPSEQWATARSIHFLRIGILSPPFTFEHLFKWYFRIKVRSSLFQGKALKTRLGRRPHWPGSRRKSPVQTKVLMLVFNWMQKHYQKRPRLNHQIREPEVQVIDSEGKHLGIMAIAQALRLADENGLDLVEIGTGARPPVVKILDYGKYMYQKEKQEREHKGSKSPSQEVKTVKIGFRTGVHDLKIRSSQADKFLQKGHRVKIELRLRGRERQMSVLAKTRLEEFLKIIIQPHSLETPIKNFPGGFSILIKPQNPH